MKPLTAIVVAFSLTLFTVGAGAQTPALAVPATGRRAPSATPVTVSRTAAATGDGARKAALPARRTSSKPAAARAAAHQPHHWLRWAIVGVAAVLGVIAIVEYNINTRCPANCPGPLP